MNVGAVLLESAGDESIPELTRIAGPVPLVPEAVDGAEE
jgi:hypothetical protein